MSDQFIFWDLETTGRNDKFNQITQVGAVLTDQNVEVKFWPDEWQGDIRRFARGKGKSSSKIIVGYGSANIFDLKWFR